MTDLFVAIPHDIFDIKMSSPAFRLFALMTKVSDNETGKLWHARATLAKGIGIAKVDNVDKYIKELVEAGLVTAEPRWKDAEGNTSFERTDAYRERTSTLYTVVKRHPHKWGNSSPTAGVTPPPTEGDELEPNIYQQRSGPIPDDWEPNQGHREQALKGGHNIDAVAAGFKSWAVQKNERLRDWDLRFTAWLHKELPPKAQTGARAGSYGAKTGTYKGRVWQE